MSAPTVQKCALQILRDWGILSLTATTPNACRSSDLESAALVLSQALQTIAAKEQSEPKTQPGNAFLRAPTTVTLDCTLGSTTVANVTTYASWMEGCTIRINGDDQDNELLSSTRLGRAFGGTPGNGLTATVYADAITQDETVQKVLSPMLGPNYQSILEATSRHDFLMLGGFVLMGTYNQSYSDYPFWAVGRKQTGDRPTTFFVDAYYDSTLDYIKRRIRLSPMPLVAQTIGWTQAMNPIRVTATDIDSGSHAETNIKIPMPNGWVESIFLPVARQIGTGMPQFKNEGIRPEIARQYQEALNILSMSNGSAARAKTKYT